MSKNKFSLFLNKLFLSGLCAFGAAADLIVTPCTDCQMNMEVYQYAINANYKIKFKMPVLSYRQLLQ